MAETDKALKVWPLIETMSETQGFSEKQTHSEDLLWLAPGSHVGIVNELQNHPGFIMFSHLRNTQAVRARSQALGLLAFQSLTTLSFQSTWKATMQICLALLH